MKASNAFFALIFVINRLDVNGKGNNNDGKTIAIVLMSENATSGFMDTPM